MRSDPNVAAIVQAKDKITAAFPAAKIEVAGGVGATAAAKAAAVKTRISMLSGYVTLGVTAAVTPQDDADTGDGSFWIVHLTKGGVTDSVLVKVTAFVGTAADSANTDAVNTAKAILGTATENFTAFKVKVPKGPSASAAAKQNALRSAILSLSGFSASGVAFELEQGASDAWTVYFAKGAAADFATIAEVIFYDGNVSDHTAVSEAKAKILAGNPFGSVRVNGGTGAALAGKRAQIKSNILMFSGYVTLGVTTTVSAVDEADINDGSRWVVALSKGTASDAVIITVTHFLDSL